MADDQDDSDRGLRASSSRLPEAGELLMGATLVIRIGLGNGTSRLVETGSSALLDDCPQVVGLWEIGHSLRSMSEEKVKMRIDHRTGDTGQTQNGRAKRALQEAVGINHVVQGEESAVETGSTASVALNWSQLAQELPQLCSVARIASVCMGMQNTSRFGDPVEVGIVSMMEMQCVFSKFKECFGRLLPVSDYLFGCNVQQLPNHPFIRAAIIHHVAARGGQTALLSRQQCLRIYDCIQDHLLAVQSAEPSRDILRALLILSYCSNRQYAPTFAVPDCFKAAALAYDMAKDLCLDYTIAKLPTLRPADLKEEWNKRLLDNAALWYAIAHRYTWMKLLRSVGMDTHFSSDRSVSNTLSSVFLRESKSEILEHLFAESALLEILSPLAPHFRKYIGHFASPYNPMEYEEGQSRIEAAHARFTIWRADHRSSPLKSMEELLTSSYYVQFCLCMKVSTLIQALPKPLHPNFMTSLQHRNGQALIACAADLLERIAAVKINFGTIPHYFLDLTFLPLGIARSYNLADMTSDNFALSRKTLDYVSKRLRAAHYSIPAVLPRFDTAISGLPEETFTPSDTLTQADHLHTLDYSAWQLQQEYPMLVPQPLPEFLQGMLHSDFAAWPASLEPFGLGTMMWPGSEAVPSVMTPLQFTGNNS
ncbi:hypothetical protein QFC24_004781 [Naganishia onofrii]|uniref:Uncharacterized protein n=1 Tax=Naganishia onofrii TaxID=1851511 RepID=A0ACC2XCT0_9TREE|nr:hypothetical protein QFC24_004781 [Naganishia onofrii]